jgi:hypothetical protein
LTTVRQGAIRGDLVSVFCVRKVIPRRSAMSKRQEPRLRVEEFEPRFAPATWIVISPGTHAVVVEQAVPNAAVAGLTNAALHANGDRLDSCWIVRPDTPGGE